MNYSLVTIQFFPLLILSPGYDRSPCVPLMAEDVIAEVQVSMNLRETVGIVLSDYFEVLCLRSNTFTWRLSANNT